MGAMDRIIREDARLIVLKALAERADETLNSSHIDQVLREFAVREDRAWIHEELRWLARMDAVEIVSEAGSVLVVRLTDKGARHVRREIAIEGIKRPGRGSASIVSAGLALARSSLEE